MARRNPFDRLAALRASLNDEESDEEQQRDQAATERSTMPDIVSKAFSSIGSKRFHHRGDRLIAHMNKHRLDQRPSSAPPHQRRQAEFLNRRAKTSVELLDLDSNRAWRSDRPGAHKKWVPGAVLDLVFVPNRPSSERHLSSARERAARRRSRAEQRIDLAPTTRARSRRPPTQPTNANQVTKALARERRAGHTHCNHLQTAVAQTIIDTQRDLLADLPDVPHGVLEISLDETEMRVGVPRAKIFKRTRMLWRLRPVLMMHATLLWAYTNAAPRVLELCIPPVVLIETTAAALLSALILRASAIIKCCGKLKALVLVMHSDSARACLRQFMLLRKAVEVNLGITTIVLAIHVLCQMHLLFLAINSVHRPLYQIGPLFCATNLVHRGPIYDAFLIEVEAHIKRNVRITLVPPTEADRQATNAVAELLLWDCDWDGPDANTQRRRAPDYIEAVRLFKILFTGPYNTRVIHHFCPYGCTAGCTGRADTARLMTDVLMVLIYAWLPDVPALNRWTKLYPPMLWWLLAPLDDYQKLLESLWAVRSTIIVSHGPIVRSSWFFRQAPPRASCCMGSPRHAG